MNLKAPIKAFTPFVNSIAHFRSSKGRNGSLVNLCTPACIMESGVYNLDNGVGESNSDNTWVVIVTADKFEDFVPEVGTIIDADENHPRLYINSVHRNNNLFHFDCTALERGK